MILRIVLWSAIALVGTFSVVAFIGWTLPVAHRVSRSVTVRAPNESVYVLVSDVERAPTWRSRVSRVEMLPSVDGRSSFREIGKDGSISYVVEEAVPAQRLVTRISDRSLPFGGRWIFEMSPAADGTALRITEEGEVYNPIFRFVARFILGHESTIRAYLEDVERHFNREKAAP
jgi:uncharacterized protein YndB with AHSA1/START domain